jgi:hypothetical protein
MSSKLLSRLEGIQKKLVVKKEKEDELKTRRIVGMEQLKDNFGVGNLEEGEELFEELSEELEKRDKKLQKETDALENDLIEKGILT